MKDNNLIKLNKYVTNLISSLEPRLGAADGQKSNLEFNAQLTDLLNKLIYLSSRLQKLNKDSLYRPYEDMSVADTEIIGRYLKQICEQKNNE